MQPWIANYIHCRVAQQRMLRRAWNLGIPDDQHSNTPYLQCLGRSKAGLSGDNLKQIGQSSPKSLMLQIASSADLGDDGFLGHPRI